MDHRVSKIIALLAANLRRDLSLAEAAEHVNLSISRMRHLFKAETGMSIVKYLKTLRLQKARERLETTPLSIKEIMIQVGIKDKSDFAKDFKNKYGLSPKQYRITYQEAIAQENASTTNRIADFTNK